MFLISFKPLKLNNSKVFTCHLKNKILEFFKKNPFNFKILNEKKIKIKLKFKPLTIFYHKTLI